MTWGMMGKLKTVGGSMVITIDLVSCNQGCDFECCMSKIDPIIFLVITFLSFSRHKLFLALT